MDLAATPEIRCVMKKYDIHPDFARFPVFTLKFRTLTLWFINLLTKLQCALVRRRLRLAVTVHHLPRPDGTRLKVFRMKPEGAAEPAPALVYYHGGAFAITYASLHLKNCERYAREAGCIVIFVDYRLAPRFRFPAGFDDCYRSLRWVVDNAGNLGIDPERIAVGGDSAGGALAAGVAQRARDEGLVKLCGQMLVYPVLDNTCSTPSATDFVDVPLWNARSNRNMWDMYLRPFPAAKAPLYAAPGHGALRGLPLSYVETAEFDPLRDEGLRYIDKLRQAGVAVQVNETKRTVHGYDAIAGSDIARQSLLARINFLNEAFRPRSA